MEASVIFEKDLISRYDRAGPRYTSYPTALQFNEEFDCSNYIENALLTNENPVPKPLSLYFHLPFCSTVCYYCACNKIITKNRSHAAPYLKLLHQELEMQAKLFDQDRVVEQLHWGGGTPTFISMEQMSELMKRTRAQFSLRDDDQGEYSIELDPRECTVDTASFLRSLGFNRISLGVQDFHAEVQIAVNRIQTEKQTLALIDSARKEGFKSVSIDLIYGLPKQSVDSFAETLEKVISMRPDRLSIFNYAHLPDRFKVQKQINESDLPDAATKLDIFQNNIKTMLEAGYLYIGMDHFALPNDELAIAQDQGGLIRNFQGYSTRGDCDIVSFGISAISKIGDCYAQNHHEIPDYEKAIKAGKIPIFRGYKLDNDDLLRQYIITQLICHFTLDFGDVEGRYLVDFYEYFYNELQALKVMQKDGLLSIAGDNITITPAGRLLVRNICMVFDKYLRQAGTNQTYSRVL